MDEEQGRNCRGFFDTARIFPGRKLDSLTLLRVWRVLILSIVCISSADYLIRPSGIHLGPLYVMVICLAAWRLGFRTAFLVAIMSTILSAAISLATPGQPLISTVGEIVVYVVVFTALAGIVSRFRLSFDREWHLARRDWVTGILNRQEFERQAGTKLASTAIHNQPLLLAYFDLDGFKAVNDLHGHSAGDGVLQRLAEVVGRAMHPGDCFGRMGGDEFAALVSLPSVEEARTMTEFLHAQFTMALKSTGHAVTCSMGALVVAPGTCKPLAELIREADRLMYTAKQGGKDSFRLLIGSTPPLNMEVLLSADSVQQVFLAFR